jgi:hypothetical protein
MPNDCHTYYVPNFHDFHMEIVWTLLLENAISMHFQQKYTMVTYDIGIEWAFSCNSNIKLGVAQKLMKYATYTCKIFLKKISFQKIIF